MKRAISLLAASVFAIACEDEPSKPAAVPTAPTVAPAAPAAAITASDLPSGASTICRVYVTERDVAKAQLDSTATDTLMLSRVKTLDALVKETCN